MRRPFIAGNWKMNLDRDACVALSGDVVAGLGSMADRGSQAPTEVAVCPPSLYLDAVAQTVKGSAVGLGAQDMYHEPSGAFTGEISGGMLRDIGCQYVILGHSERRNVLGESNRDVNLKLHAALAAGLTPIVCVGELLEQREAGETLAVVKDQFTGSFADIPAAKMAGIVIAYEPVWAIGTGKVATPAQAEEVHGDLRRILASEYNSEVAEQVRIQYGGSVKSDNAAELLAQPNIDGALVGGAALKADSFLAIVAAAQDTVAT